MNTMLRMQKLTFLLLAGWMFLPAAFVPAQNIPLTTLASLPPVLDESSGLVQTDLNELWSLNDGGNAPEIYCLDTMGNLLRTIYIDNASNVDWEELTIGKNGQFLIGDFGNNGNSRTNLRILIIPSPDSLSSDTVSASFIHYSYVDQAAFPPHDSLKNYDMEAMVAVGDSIYLFSKNRTSPFDGYTRMYVLPQDTGTHIAQYRDRYLTGSGSSTSYWICGAALSPDGEHLLLISYDRVWIFSCFVGTDFFGGSAVVRGYAFGQTEAITWKNDNEIYITDELFQGAFGGKLYQADLSAYVLEPDVDLGPDTLLYGDSLVLDAGMLPGASYSWSHGDNQAQSTVFSSGTYAVTVTAANGCTSIDSIVVQLLVGFENGFLPTGPTLKIGPNPFRESTVISYSLSNEGHIHFQLLDVRGRIILRSEPQIQAPGIYQYDLGKDIPAGAYFLQMVYPSGAIWRQLQKLQ